MRPALVLADPDLMASAPMPGLAATRDERAGPRAGGALHAARQPGHDHGRAAGRDAARGWRARAARPLGPGLALLAGYASGSTGIAVHHAICQTIVRDAGTPHAETNAVMLPHSARLMEPRAPDALAEFTSALGGRDLAALAALSGHTGLSGLGVAEQQLTKVAATVTEHPLLANTPQPPGEQELLAMLREAL